MHCNAMISKKMMRNPPPPPARCCPAVSPPASSFGSLSDTNAVDSFFCWNIWWKRMKRISPASLAAPLTAQAKGLFYPPEVEKLPQRVQGQGKGFLSSETFQGIKNKANN